MANLHSIILKLCWWKSRKPALQGEEHIKALVSEVKVLRGKLQETQQQLEETQASLSVSEWELEKLKKTLSEERGVNSTLRAGTSTLLQFIHRTHRLSTPTAEGTIRAALQKGMKT